MLGDVPFEGSKIDVDPYPVNQQAFDLGRVFDVHTHAVNTTDEPLVPDPGNPV